MLSVSGNSLNTARPSAATKSRFLAPLRSARNDVSSRARRGICFSSHVAKNVAVSNTEVTETLGVFRVES